MSRPFHSSNTFIQGIASEAEAFPIPPPAVSGPLTAESSPLPPKTRFAFLFDHKDADRLETKQNTVLHLKELGASMREQEQMHSKIPSAYTYFGQFIAHDLTFDPITKDMPLTGEIDPLDPAIVNALPNGRSGLLDLDSVYGPGFDDVETFDVPRDNNNNEKLKVGAAYRPINSVPGTDLPRIIKKPFPARIGDPRNDENLPLSQLHLAFLKAHNRLIESNLSFADAQSLLKRRYQNLVVKDFLGRLVHPDDIAQAVAKKELYSPAQDDLFIPIEFSAAAFRFGHSMIRSQYTFNTERGTVSLRSLFTPDAMGNYFAILGDWVIDWSNFMENGTNKARSFHPQLVEPLEKLIDKRGLRFSLAVNDLLRGYLLSLPTGQGLAKALKVPDPLTKDEVLASAISPRQKEVLEAGGFDKATPLWFYLFAEARVKRGGLFLGPVCGQLVALVLLELARRSNYEDDEPWNETLGKKDGFNLSQFLMHTLP